MSEHRSSAPSVNALSLFPKAVELVKVNAYDYPYKSISAFRETSMQNSSAPSSWNGPQTMKDFRYHTCSFKQNLPAVRRIDFSVPMLGICRSLDNAVGDLKQALYRLSQLIDLQDEVRNQPVITPSCNTSCELLPILSRTPKGGPSPIALVFMAWTFHRRTQHPAYSAACDNVLSLYLN